MTGIFIIMEFIVFGIEQVDPGTDIMEASDLFLKRNELIPFLGIAGNRQTGDRKFNASLMLDGDCDDGVVSEDFLDLVGIGRFAPDADSCSQIIRELGTAKAEGVGRLIHQG